MNFANFFIKRPIFATVLAIILTLMGVVSMRVLPIEQYPSVVPPTVAVTAQFPGADAETVAQTVAAPLAEAINGVENMLYITSTSSDNGTMRMQDRKSTRLNSSHVAISYAVFCLKKKKSTK